MCARPTTHHDLVSVSPDFFFGGHNVFGTDSLVLLDRPFSYETRQTTRSRNFSELHEAIHGAEYFGMDDYNDPDDGGYEDEYNEFEDYDSEWIDVSDIPEDQTFEEPELACILENLQKGRKGSIIVKGERDLAKVSTETRRVAKATAPKTTNMSDRSCKVIASTEAGEIYQPVLRTKDSIDHSLPTLVIFSPVLVASSLEKWGILQELF